MQKMFLYFSVFNCFFNFSDVDSWHKGHYCSYNFWFYQVLRASQTPLSHIPMGFPLEGWPNFPLQKSTLLLRAFSGTKVHTQQSSSVQNQCYLGKSQNNAYSDLWHKVQSSHALQVGWLWSVLHLLPKVHRGIKVQAPTVATGWIPDCSYGSSSPSLPHFPSFPWITFQIS